MAFTDKEKREWHDQKKADNLYDDGPINVECAHCGAPVGAAQAKSEFPLCIACDK